MRKLGIKKIAITAAVVISMSAVSIPMASAAVVHPNANTCDLPTLARPGDIFVRDGPLSCPTPCSQTGRHPSTTSPAAMGRRIPAR